MFLITFLWFALAIIVGVAANTRGRSGAGWAILALFISPLIAGLLLLALPRLKFDQDRLAVARSRAQQQPPYQPPPASKALIGLRTIAIAAIVVTIGAAIWASLK